MTLNSIMCLFLILAIGYLPGCIKIGGIRFGDSAILLVALVFGHFGFILCNGFSNAMETAA